MARGSPSSRIWKFRPLNSLNGSQSAGTSASQVMVRAVPGSAGAGLAGGRQRWLHQRHAVLGRRLPRHSSTDQRQGRWQATGAAWATSGSWARARRPATGGRRAIRAPGWQAYPRPPRHRTGPTAAAVGAGLQRDAEARLHPGSGPATASAATAAPSNAPARVTSAPSMASSTSTWRGPAPTARSTASSRRRSFSPASTTATSEARLTTATSPTWPAAPFADPDHVPQLVQRHAGQHGQQRLGLVVGHEALHVEHRGPALQAHQRGGHLLGLQVELARLLGRDRIPGPARAPPAQSRWMASSACRLTCTVRSTGVPVRASTPTTVKGLSACSLPAHRRRRHAPA
jgi:hypothetical protein